MAAATDQQMQQYADEFIRPIAEQIRAMKIVCANAKALIDDIYERGSSNDRWDDERTDGPPHLLQSGDSANPDDALNFNVALTRIDQLFEGSFANVGEANQFAALWAVLERACVRAV
jgi:hypothetical protein